MLTKTLSEACRVRMELSDWKVRKVLCMDASEREWAPSRFPFGFLRLNCIFTLIHFLLSIGRNANYCSWGVCFLIEFLADKTLRGYRWIDVPESHKTPRYPPSTKFFWYRNENLLHSNKKYTKSRARSLSHSATELWMSVFQFGSVVCSLVRAHNTTTV